MDSEPLFSGNDLRHVEALVYDATLEPSYDYMRNCLVWADERAGNLTPAAYESLCDLWIARAFLHHGLDFADFDLEADYFRDIWDRAVRQGLRWPGFERLTLSDKDRAYFEHEMKEALTGEL